MKDILDLIKARRSVRKFSSAPVAEADIDKMLEAALWAPSASNRQSWKFVAVKNPSVIKEMASAVRAAVEKLKAQIEDEDNAAAFGGYSGYFTFFESAPLVIAACFNPRPNYVNVLSGKNLRPDDNLEQTTAVGAAIQNILLAAHGMGYGACWMSGPLIAEQELVKILKLEGYRLAALIPVGVALETPPAPKRKEPGKLTGKVE
ncbi:MAG TPA: nitroreductase family protein [Candidatus Wallbacteria bacterium]|nr:nitroreductase family protein [Candidatus Wallbacteria bacterium]